MMTATRTRRCAWELGRRCTDPATRRIRTTYLGEPTDRDVLFCDAHGDRAEELIRPGWAIVDDVSLAEEEHERHVADDAGDPDCALCEKAWEYWNERSV